MIQEAEGRRLSSVPSRIWALLAAILVITAGVAFAAHQALGHARSGLKIIGTDAGPIVNASGDLYIRLGDMQAQLTRMLLNQEAGQEAGQGANQEADQKAQQQYDEDGRRCHSALLTIANLTQHDPTDRTMAKSVLDALTSYQTLATQVVLLRQQNPDEALRRYDAATKQMMREILPQAYNLALSSGEIVRRSYATERSALLRGRTEVLVGGAVLVLALIGLQCYLTVEFRRVVNLGVVFALLGVLIAVTVTATLITREATLLTEAKQDGFDSVLTLARVRAISAIASAQEAQGLLDPAASLTLEGDYLENSQELLAFRPRSSEEAISLDDYQQRLASVVEGYRHSGAVPFLGLLGEEAGTRTGERQRAAMRHVLDAYQQVQNDDRTIRELILEGKHDAALRIRMGEHSGGALADFAAYDRAVQRLQDQHARSFRSSVRTGQGLMRGWWGGVPVVAGALCLVVLAGVRPRLIEYR